MGWRFTCNNGTSAEWWKQLGIARLDGGVGVPLVSTICSSPTPSVEEGGGEAPVDRGKRGQVLTRDYGRRRWGMDSPVS
jgi:hypothetical protein